MDECDGLENRYTRKGIVGSNPTPSAKYSRATAPSGRDSNPPEIHREGTIWDQKYSLNRFLINETRRSCQCYWYESKRYRAWRVSMKDYQRVLRMQLRQLERQRANVLEATMEVKRRMGLLEEVASWNLPVEESA